MSLTNESRNLIDIQDSNITFEENFFQKGSFKKKQCKYIYGKLSYTPTYCQYCGIKNETYIIYKNGTQTSRITLPFIKNSFHYSYNNGRTEGINNKIKVLNRVAYGYRNFSNDKRRIFMYFTFQENQSKAI